MPAPKAPHAVNLRLRLDADLIDIGGPGECRYLVVNDGLLLKNPLNVP